MEWSTIWIRSWCILSMNLWKEFRYFGQLISWKKWEDHYTWKCWENIGYQNLESIKEYFTDTTRDIVKSRLEMLFPGPYENWTEESCRITDCLDYVLDLIKEPMVNRHIKCYKRKGYEMLYLHNFNLFVIWSGCQTHYNVPDVMTIEDVLLKDINGRACTFDDMCVG